MGKKKEIRKLRKEEFLGAQEKYDYMQKMIMLTNDMNRKILPSSELEECLNEISSSLGSIDKREEDICTIIKKEKKSINALNDNISEFLKIIREVTDMINKKDSLSTSSAKDVLKAAETESGYQENPVSINDHPLPENNILKECAQEVFDEEDDELVPEDDGQYFTLYYERKDYIPFRSVSIFERFEISDRLYIKTGEKTAVCLNDIPEKDDDTLLPVFSFLGKPTLNDVDFSGNTYVTLVERCMSKDDTHDADE